MPYVIATTTGLLRVDDRGRVTRLAEGEFLHVVPGEEDGEAVALDDLGQVWDVDEDGAAPYESFTEAKATCLLVDGSDVWVGVHPAGLYHYGDNGFVRVESFDAAPGRERWTTPWGAPASVRSLDIGDDETMWANIHVGGILCSTDGGASWRPTVDMNVDVHQVFAVPGHEGTVVAACGEGGLAMTTDGGDTWTMSTEGLASSYCRAVAVAHDTVLLSSQEGPQGGGTTLHRRPLDDPGAPFTPCRGGLPEALPGGIDTFAVTAWDEQAAVALPNGDLYTSTDAGYAWRRLVGSLGEVRAVTIL